MRRATTLMVVMLSVSLLSVSQASAFGWLGQRRAARHQNYRYRTVAVAPDVENTDATAAKPVSKSKAKPAPADEAAVLAELIDVVKAILIVENERLDRALELHEEAERVEYGEDD